MTAWTSLPPAVQFVLIVVAIVMALKVAAYVWAGLTYRPRGTVSKLGLDRDGNPIYTRLKD